MNEQVEQEILHTGFENALREIGRLKDGEHLTAWSMYYEVMRPNGDPVVARLNGPAGVTAWRALGIVEFVSRSDGFAQELWPGDPDEDD